MYFYNTSSHNSASKIPHYTTRILGRRFALTITAYKYLDIGISMRSMSSVEMSSVFFGDNKGNQIILRHATWKTFIERRANIKLKLRLHDTYLYMKSVTDIIFIRTPTLRRACIFLAVSEYSHD